MFNIKIRLLSLVVATAISALSAGNASATTISLTSPDSVNRIIEFNGPPFGDLRDTVFTTFFSTFSNGTTNVQSSIVGTSNSSLLNALATTLGALGSGQSYVINSASLTVGSLSDNYTVASSAHRFLANWDTASLTWNNCGTAPGCVAGTDYMNPASAIGVVDGVTQSTSWDLTADVATALDGGSDLDFFFPAVLGTGFATFTLASNVSWQIDASIETDVLEPSTLSVLAFGLAGFGYMRRRRAA